MIRAQAQRSGRDAREHDSDVPEADVTRMASTTGRPLEGDVQERLGAAWGGVDLGKVAIHTDRQAAESAASLGADAYTVGHHVAFAQGRYAPGTPVGDRLLAHELAHVVQQRDTAELGSTTPAVGHPHAAAEDQAERLATAATAEPAGGALGSERVAQAAGGPVVRRRVEMRDVGRGEQSGFARLPDLIARLNAISQGLTLSMNGAELTYTLRPGGRLSELDRLLQRVVDQEAVVPLRLTNRHGLLGTHAGGFSDQVIFDAYDSGYLDVDDLLASSDLGIQVALAHVLTERSTTRDYDRRIGTAGLGPSFAAAHGRGITAEEQVLHDFFGDPTIRVGPEPAHPAIGAGSLVTARTYRNSRHDSIRWRIRRGAGKAAGVDPSELSVRTHDGRTLTAEEYRDQLRDEAVAAQVESERLRGATEHTEGARRVPAP